MYEVNMASEGLRHKNTDGKNTHDPDNMGFSEDGGNEFHNDREKKVKENFFYFGGISLIYGIIFAFCMYRNLFGATFALYSLVTVAVLIIFLNKINLKINKETKICFLLTVLCGISTCITANRLIQFLNWCCVIILLLLAMVSEFFEDRKWNLLYYFVYLSTLFFTTIAYSFTPIKHAKENMSREKIKSREIDYRILLLAVTGAAAAAGVLVIVFPLLISSDMIFRKMFSGVFSVMEFARIVPNLITGAGIIVTIFIGFALIYAFFYASCRADFKMSPERKIRRYHPVTGIAFSTVIALVYLLYSGVQIVYLFLGVGLPEGITYSEYAHSGFWQLLAVAFINVCMVMTCMYLFEENGVLKVILTIISFCTFIMIVSAAYRMKLYIEMYHLTFLRLAVLCFLTLLALIMAGVVASIYKKDFKLVQYMIGITVCGYILFSFSQPDYWIARYNVKHMGTINIRDLEYMMSGLSLDAAPVIAEINPLNVEVSGDYYGYDMEAENDSAAEYYDVVNCFYNYYWTISENNQHIYFRKANYSRIRAKRIADEYLESVDYYDFLQ